MGSKLIDEVLTSTIVGVARLPSGFPDDADAVFVLEWV